MTDQSTTTSTPNGKPLLTVHMSSPENILFEGTAEAVTSVNDDGEFDLLPLHENFICIVKKKAVIHIKIGGEKKEFPIESGVIKVQRNRVYILTGFEIIDFSTITPKAEGVSSQVQIPSG